jgi:hypothetical protein
MSDNIKRIIVYLSIFAFLASFIYLVYVLLYEISVKYFYYISIMIVFIHYRFINLIRKFGLTTMVVSKIKTSRFKLNNFIDYFIFLFVGFELAEFFREHKMGYSYLTVMFSAAGLSYYMELFRTIAELKNDNKNS